MFKKKAVLVCDIEDDEPTFCEIVDKHQHQKLCSSYVFLQLSALIDI
jgi:hypothetical protein